MLKLDHLFRSLAVPLALAAALSACSSGGGPALPGGPAAAGDPVPQTATQSPQEKPGAAMPQLPAVADLPQVPRSGSYVEADLEIAGEDYDQSMPSRAVQVFNSPVLNFMPANIDETHGLGDCAFACYHFSVPGYDRDNLVNINWAATPVDPDNVWIGLSNWGSGRWDWYQHQPGGYIQPADLKQYFSASGDLYLVVMTVGWWQYDLDNIHLGLPAPIINVQQTPLFGPAPLEVDFDASESLPPLGLISSYEWDMDGDGEYEVLSESPLHSHLFETEGEFTVLLRVTNSIGNRSVKELSVKVGPYWQRSLGRSKFESVGGMVADADGNVYLAGTSGAPSEDFAINALIASFNKLGTLRWAMEFDAPGDYAAFNSIDIDTDGNLIVGGLEEQANQQTRALIQKWSSGGGLLWSRSFGEGESCQVNAVKTDGATIYFCGSLADPIEDLICGRMSSSGNLDWLRWRGDQFWDEGTEIALTTDIIGGVTGVAVLGYYTGPQPQLQQRIWKLGFSTEGDYSGGMVLSGSTDQTPGSLLVDNSLTGTHYIISGKYVDGEVDRGFLLRMPENGDSIAGITLDGGDFFTNPPQLSEAPGSGTLLTGHCYENVGPGPSSFSFLLELDSSYGLIAGEKFTDESGFVLQTGASAYQGGLLGWGVAYDKGPQWSVPLKLGVSSYSNSWQNQSASGGAKPWNEFVSPGSAMDITIELTQDSGAGESDCLVYYRPLP